MSISWVWHFNYFLFRWENQKMDADNRVILNCGGIRHESYKTTLKKEFASIKLSHFIIEKKYSLQGGNQLLTKSMDQLWPLFESWWLFDHTGGSPDVVHLIINASQASDLLLKAQTGLEKNSPVFKHWSKFINFWDIVIIDFHSFLFKIKKNNVFKQEIGFTWY